MSELKLRPPEEKKQIDIGLMENLRPNEWEPPRCRPFRHGATRASKPTILRKVRSVWGAQDGGVQSGLAITPQAMRAGAPLPEATAWMMMAVPPLLKTE